MAFWAAQNASVVAALAAEKAEWAAEDAEWAAEDESIGKLVAAARPWSRTRLVVVALGRRHHRVAPPDRGVATGIGL